MAELKFELHSPLTEEDWDLITDVDLDHTPSVMFHTKHGKDVEYVKVKHGRWETCENGRDAICTNCRKYWIPIEDKYDYWFCPRCGARMDEPEAEP